MKKRFIIIILFALGLGCFALYSIIGSRLAPDGTLIEPFFLIPIGYVCFFIGTMLLIIHSILYFFKKVHSV